MLPRPGTGIIRCRGLLQKRYLSTTIPRSSYADTISNLKIGAHTRVIFQGFTGRQATVNAKESIEWGTNIVGGVTPGKEGEHLGLPLFPSVRRAMAELKPDATGIYVAAHQCPGAIEEALEAEVPLVVVVAEHIPLHDIMRIHSMLNTQSKCRLVGANSPGIISAVGKCRIGFQPLPCFTPGRIGIVAKSGTLSYEAVASTSLAGLGQSLCIGMGGDVIAGTNFVDVLEVFEKDDDTEGIVLIGEIGGTAEMDAAAWIKSYHERTSNPKPISALVGGVNAVPGRVFGHAGAFISPGEPDALTKSKALSDVGVTIVDHPSRFGSTMKTLLEKSVKGGNTIQKRGLHSLNRTSRPRATSPKVLRFQKRSLYIRGDLALNMLRQSGVNASEYSGQGKQRLLAISVDRTNRCPCVVASPTVDPDQIYTRSKKFPFDYREGLKEDDIKAISLHLELEQSSRDSLPKLTQALLDIFMKKEAFLVETKFVERLGELKVTDARFGFDDAAYRSAKRQADVHALRRVEDEDPTEVEAEKDGIVYIKLHGSGTIGTLVNGAGLAMNVVDKLGGRSTNFLDTGGKATSETIKRSFQAVLQDQRAKVVFVNIFGGLTMGDMIARGILLAFRDLDMSLPVVVRIRGTNEAEGQRIIAESGLPLYAYQDFDEAAAKAVELADG